MPWLVSYWSNNPNIKEIPNRGTIQLPTYHALTNYQQDHIYHGVQKNEKLSSNAQYYTRGAEGWCILEARCHRSTVN